MTSTIPSAFELLDERFAACRGDDRVEQLFTGGRWTEGPVYVPAGRYLLFDDIPNDRMLRYAECTAAGVAPTSARAPSASSASRPATPTATRSTARAGS